MCAAFKLSDAIAHALNDGGIQLATHVPGFGAIQTFEAFCKLTGKDFPTSFHEEVAFGIAHGAAIAGMRSAVIIKSHGLAKAMNAVMDSLSAGVTAGMVICVFEDPGGSHSDNIIDIEPLVRGSGIPYYLVSAKNGYDLVISAIAQSEKDQLPIVLIFNANEINTMTTFKSQKLSAVPAYNRDIIQRLVVPLFAEYQREVLLMKSAHMSWKNIRRPETPTSPDSLPPDYQRAVAPYQPLFSTLKKIETGFVSGDTGVSTLSALSPYDIVHTATYMGGSVPLAMGASLAGFKNAWAFTGDFSFIAAGHIALIEAIMRKLPIKVLLFANGKAQTTGGQTLELELMERILKGYEPYIRRIANPADESEALGVLKEANDAADLRIIIANFT